jgi:hypothetical protein
MPRSSKKSVKVGDNRTNKELMAEIDRLSKEIAKLEAKKPKKNGIAWRKLFVVLSASLAIACFTVFNLSFWLNRTIVNNEQFAQTVTPIIKDEEVQKVLANRITDRVFDKVDLEQKLQENLPENVQFIAGPLTSKVEDFANQKVLEVVSSPKTAEIWNTTITKTHDVIIGYVQNPNSTGQINVDQIYQAASKELQDSRLSILANKDLPDSIGSVNVVDIKWFPQVRNYLNILKNINIALLFGSVIFSAIAIALSKKKLKLAITISSYVFASMLALLIALQILINQGSLQAAIENQAAVKAILHIVTNPLANQLAGFAGLFGSVVIFALISSRFKWAIAMRNTYRRANDYLLGAMLRKVKSSSPGWIIWLAQQRLIIVWSLISIFYVVFAFRIPPTIDSAIDALITSVIAVFVLEVFSSINRVLPKK